MKIDGRPFKHPNQKDEEIARLSTEYDRLLAWKVQQRDEALARAERAEAEVARLREALTQIADPDGRHSKRATDIAHRALSEEPRA